MHFGSGGAHVCGRDKTGRTCKCQQPVRKPVARRSRRLTDDVDASYYEDRNNRGCTKLNGHVLLVLHGFAFILEPVFIQSFLHSILKICIYIS